MAFFSKGGPEKLAIYNKWHYSSNAKRQGYVYYLLLLLLFSGVLMALASGVMPGSDQKQRLLIADEKTILYDLLLNVCGTPGRQILAFGKKSAEIGQHILATSSIGVVPVYSLLAF